METKMEMENEDLFEEEYDYGLPAVWAAEVEEAHMFARLTPFDAHTLLRHSGLRDPRCPVCALLADWAGVPPLNQTLDAPGV